MGTLCELVQYSLNIVTTCDGACSAGTENVNTVEEPKQRKTTHFLEFN